MIDKLLTKLLGRKCPRCRSRQTIPGYYSRGHNTLHNQAVGNKGIWCNGCCRVSFDQSIEDFKNNLPEWCRAYND